MEMNVIFFVVLDNIGIRDCIFSYNIYEPKVDMNSNYTICINKYAIINKILHV